MQNVMVRGMFCLELGNAQERVPNELIIFEFRSPSVQATDGAASPQSGRMAGDALAK